MNCLIKDEKWRKGIIFIHCQKDTPEMHDACAYIYACAPQTFLKELIGKCKYFCLKVYSIVGYKLFLCVPSSLNFVRCLYEFNWILNIFDRVARILQNKYDLHCSNAKILWSIYQKLICHWLSYLPEM